MKEKELQLQKDEVEFLLAGIRHAVLFSEAMMKEGSDTEIVASHRQVIARMTTLTGEREKAQLEPVTDAEIELIGGNQLDSAIREYGVVATGISAEKSIIEIPQTGNKSQINQAYFFKVIMVDKKGNKASKEVVNKAVKGLAVEVVGPYKVKVHWFTSFVCCKTCAFFTLILFSPLFFHCR